MKNNLTETNRMKDLVIDKSFNQLLKFLIDSKCSPDCEKLKDKIDLFKFINWENLYNNSNYVCYNNLKDMYITNEIPINVFWVSYINTDPERIPVNLYDFLEELNRITQNINDNSFNLINEWYFDFEGDSGVFLDFKKSLEGTEQFISIFIAVKSFNEAATITEIIKSKK